MTTQLSARVGAPATYALFLGLCLLPAVTTTSHAQNPRNDTVVFMHGTFGGVDSWQSAANRLQKEFRMQSYIPVIYSLTPEATQAQALATDLAPYNNNLAGYAKSNGALVVRGYMMTNSKINRMTTVAGVNRGAPLASAVYSGAIFYYPAQVEIDLFNACDYYRVYETRASDVLFEACDELSTMFGVLDDTPTILEAWGLVYYVSKSIAPAVEDMQPNSQYVLNLNSATNLAREASIAPRRVSIEGAMDGTRDVLFYGLLPQFAGGLSYVRQAVEQMSLNLYLEYSLRLDPSVPNYYQLHFGAQRWLSVWWDMVDIDPWWLNMIGAVPVYGSPGNFVAPANDGILPVTSQSWPGTGVQHILVHPTTHLTIQYDPGANSAFDAAGLDMGLIPRTTQVNSVVLSPANPALVTGQTLQMNAVARDPLDAPLPGRTFVWSSSNTPVASVSTSGLVTAVAPGTATITASVDGYSTTSAVTVTNVTAPTAAIAGPASVKPGSTCTWTSSASGGLGPYSFAWTFNGAFLAPTIGTTTVAVTAGNTSFTLKTTVTDVGGRTASTTRTIAVSSLAPVCTTSGQ